MAANMDYAGDEVLSAHLSAIGADGNIAAVRALIAGVVGASSADDAWMQLVTPHLNDTVRKQLSALRDQIAGEKQVDFSVRPSTDRVDKLREQLAKDGLDGFIVPRTDEHQGEFVAPRAERLRWLTGFSGSAGLAIVLKDTAAIFIDGRYTLQVRQQTITEAFEPHHLIESPADKWISATLPDGGRLGYDPWLHAQISIDKYAKAAEKAGIEVSEIDLFEINEAFASQAVYCVRELGIDPDKVNVNGGAIALGHPLGCTGAKLTATLLHEMKRRGSRYGVVSMCIGGGMGAAAVFERE